jgi:fructose-1,6-bisphosphatase I
MALHVDVGAHPPMDLAAWLDARPVTPAGALGPALAGMAAAAAQISALLARGALTDDDASGRRPEGDRNTRLTALAGHAIQDALRAAGVAYLAAKDDDAIVTIDPDGHLAVAVDPLHGAHGLEANASAGTLFAVFAASADGAAASFLRTGDELLAAGYVIYGAHTALAVTARDGVATFVLDRASGAFRLADAAAQIPPQARDVAVDVTNYRYWHHPVRLLVDDCMAGKDGPRGADYTLCGTASLVAGAHRILTAGGVFLEPADHRVGRHAGGTQLLFEAFAIALIAEQAGGAASDTHRRILGRAASDLRQNTPLVFGSAAGVKLVDDYHLGPTARLGEAPLFGRRGLYRK